MHGVRVITLGICERNLFDLITDQQQAHYYSVPGSKRFNAFWGELRHALRVLLMIVTHVRYFVLPDAYATTDNPRRTIPIWLQSPKETA